MRIKIQQFLFGKSHSWSVVGQSLGRSFLKMGHEVDFVSTDGVIDKFIPNDLLSFVKNSPNGVYDMQLSYTAPHNFPAYLSHGKKNRFGIWNYEYNLKPGSKRGLLPGFAKHAAVTDFVLPSSNFTKDVFLNMGVPEEKMVVVPHGINLEDFENINPMPLKTKKSKTILLNIAQPHKRKALHLALESFGKAFTKNDDVCLVAKVLKQNKTEHTFNIDFDSLLKNFKSKFTNHAEIEVIDKFLPNLADIYSSDINFSATHTECWHLPSLEALAAGVINVVPRYGGILDFCNDDNCLLIDGNIRRADRTHQYWSTSPHAVHFVIDTNDAAKKLQYAVEKTDELKNKFAENMKKTAQKFTWDNAAKQVLDLCKG